MNRINKKVVIALGGNAILQKDQIGTYEEQQENIKKTAKSSKVESVEPEVKVESKSDSSVGVDSNINDIPEDSE